MIDDLLDNIIHADCLDILRTLPDRCIDLICTDPPYGYLNHKLDAEFDDAEFFIQAARVLKPAGGLIFFGRGVKLARWVCLCDDLGLVFKEELVWYKRNTSSPAHPIGRNHESAYLFGGLKFNVRKSMIPCEEVMTEITPGFKRNLSKLTMSIRRGDIEEMRRSLYNLPQCSRNDHITQQADLLGINRRGGMIRQVFNGARERTVMDVPRDSLYTSMHPTQKPVRLFERLIQIASDPGAVVLDPFSGSGSTALAARRAGRRYICVEADADYYQRSQDRLSSSLV